jgi:hypothetical protein
MGRKSPVDPYLPMTHQAPEHYHDHQALVAVKIGPIVEGIRRALARDKGAQT